MSRRDDLRRRAIQKEQQATRLYEEALKDEEKALNYQRDISANPNGNWFTRIPEKKEWKRNAEYNAGKKRIEAERCSLEARRLWLEAEKER